VILLISVFLSIPTFFIAETPPSPPSPAADKHIMTFKEGMSVIFKSKQFLILLSIVGLLLGLFNSYVTLISDYVTPFGYTEDQSGILGISTVVSGLVSAGLVGLYVDKTGKHQIMIQLCSLTAFIGSIFFFLGAKPNAYHFLILGSTILGAGGFPIIPMAMELGVEATFPVSEGTSTGILLLTLSPFNNEWSLYRHNFSCCLKSASFKWQFEQLYYFNDCHNRFCYAYIMVFQR
jgi:FLVCR family MFS transporter 7